MDEKRKAPQVAPIDEHTIAAMRRASAMSLPNDPSAARMKADAIRRHFWEATFGGDGSILAEMQRIIREINRCLQEGASEDGVGIESIKQTVRSQESDGVNEIVVTLTDGTTHVFYIKNGGVGPQGPEGPQGVQGLQGVPGPQGEKGEPGAQGAQGIQGVPGVKGDKGEPGEQGEQGIQGIQGEKGDKGDRGDKGDKGDKGDPFSIAKIYASVAAMNAGYATDGVAKGAFVAIDTGNVEDEENARLYIKGESAYVFLTDLSGAQGMKGEKGDKGDKGDQGDKGDTGSQGPQGLQGLKGDKGEKGDTGPEGPQGPQGLQGEKGEKGEQGPQGEQGVQGLQGEKGDKGDKGDTGPQGEKGDTGSQGPQGLQGLKGDKGDTGVPGVHVGPEAPTNGEKIWIDTDEESAEDGGTSIDVTAEVGQTIIVKEVDASGKPTKWESAEYQPRTHWKTETVILPETVVECSELDEDEDGVGDGWFSGMLPDISLTPNVQYDVYYNGTKYSCIALLFQDDEEARILVLGNNGAVTGEGDTGEPFVMTLVYYPSEGYSQNMIASLDGSTSVTLSIVETKYTPIPQQYLTNAMPYYIEVTEEKVGGAYVYKTNDTVTNVEEIYKSGRQIALRVALYNDDNTVIQWAYLQLRLAAQNPDGPGTIFLFAAAGAGTVRNELLVLTPQEDGTYIVGDTI